MTIPANRPINKFPVESMSLNDRTLTDADIDALCVALVPKIEAKLAERFYSNAGRGMFQWIVKLWQPILIALILYGLAHAPNLPQTVATTIKAAGS